MDHEWLLKLAKLFQIIKNIAIGATFVFMLIFFHHDRLEGLLNGEEPFLMVIAVTLTISIVSIIFAGIFEFRALKKKYKEEWTDDSK